MRLFLDTHDRSQQTFPEQLSPEEFEQFYAGYEKICYEEGVIPLRIHVGLEAGRAFCLNLAKDAAAVKRVHDRVGLPFDSIVEVQTASPQDLLFQHKALAEAAS